MPGGTRPSRGLSFAGWFEDGHQIFERMLHSDASDLRAPRLRRLLKAALADLDSGAPALVEELRTRHLLVFIEPSGLGMGNWDGVGRALPAFTDMESIMRAGDQMGRPPDSYAIGSVPAPELYRVARDKGYPVLLNGFLDGDQVRYSLSQDARPFYLRLPERYVAVLLS